MGQQAVCFVSNVATVSGEMRPTGCSKSIMHETDEAETSVFRVQPGGGVPVHLHSRVFDLFLGISGEVEIAYEGQLGSAKLKLTAGAFCAMPPGVRHEVRNLNPTDEAVFVLVHAPQKGYDNIPVPFKEYSSVFPAPNVGRVSGGVSGA